MTIFIRLLSVCVALIVLIAQASAGPILTLDFTATAIEVIGSPFAISAIAGDTQVTGRVFYDQGAARSPDNTTNIDFFPSTISGGIELLVGSTLIMSSNYYLTTGNDYTSFMGFGDHFNAEVISRQGGSFSVDGVVTLSAGNIRLDFGDLTGAMFPTDDSIATLPTLDLLMQYVGSLVGIIDDFSSGGEIRFGRTPVFASALPTPAPEPATLALLALGLAGLGYRRRKRAG